MDLDELRELARRSRRAAAPAAGSAEYERIYAAARDRHAPAAAGAGGAVGAAAAPAGVASRARRRTAWPAVLATVAVAAVVLVLFIVPLPRLHLSSPGAKVVPGGAGKGTAPGGGTAPVSDSVPTTAPQETALQPAACAALGAGDSSVAYLLSGDAAATSLEAVALPAGKVLWSEAVPVPVPGAKTPQYFGGEALALSPDGATLYVATGIYGGKSWLETISAATGALSRSTPIGPVGPLTAGLAVSPDGRTAYVAESGNIIVGEPPGVARIVRVNLLTDKDEQVRGGPYNPLGVAFSGDGGTVYTTTGSDVVPIDVADNHRGAPIQLPMRQRVTDGFSALVTPGAIAVSVSGDEALVGNQQFDLGEPAATLNVVSLPSGRVEAPVELGGDVDGTSSIAFTCDGAAAFAVTNDGLRRVNLPDRSAVAVEAAPAQAGGTPRALDGGVAVAPAAGDEMWVAYATDPLSESCSSDAPCTGTISFALAGPGSTLLTSVANVQLGGASLFAMSTGHVLPAEADELKAAAAASSSAATAATARAGAAGAGAGAG